MAAYRGLTFRLDPRNRIPLIVRIIGELNRVIYGKRSEKLPPDERQFAFEDHQGLRGVAGYAMRTPHIWAIQE